MSEKTPAKSGGGVVGAVAQAIGALDVQYTHNKGDVLVSVNTADDRINFMTGGNKRGRLAELDRLQRERASALSERQAELSISEAEIRQENLSERLRIEHEEKVRRMKAQRAADEAAAAKSQAEMAQIEAEMRRKQNAIEALDRVGKSGSGALQSYAELLNAGSAVTAAGDEEIQNTYDQLVDRVSGRTLRLDDGSSASINQLAGMLNMDVNSNGFALAADKILQQQGVNPQERTNIINSVRAGIPGVASMGNGAGEYLLETMEAVSSHAGGIKQIDEDTLRNAQETQAKLDAQKTKQMQDSLTEMLRISENMTPAARAEYDKYVMAPHKRLMDAHFRRATQENQRAFGAPVDEPPAIPGQAAVDPRSILSGVNRMGITSATDTNPMLTAEHFDQEMKLMVGAMEDLDVEIAARDKKTPDTTAARSASPMYPGLIEWTVANQTVANRQDATKQQKILNDAEGMMRALVWQNPDNALIPEQFRQDLKDMRARGWWNLDEAERENVIRISKALSVEMVEEYRLGLEQFPQGLTQDQIDKFRDKWYSPTQQLDWTPANAQDMTSMTTGRELSPDGQTEEEEAASRVRANRPGQVGQVRNQRISGAFDVLGRPSTSALGAPVPESEVPIITSPSTSQVFDDRNAAISDVVNNIDLDTDNPQLVLERVDKVAQDVREINQQALEDATPDKEELEKRLSSEKELLSELTSQYEKDSDPVFIRHIDNAKKNIAELEKDIKKTKKKGTVTEGKYINRFAKHLGLRPESVALDNLAIAEAWGRTGATEEEVEELKRNNQKRMAIEVELLDSLQFDSGTTEEEKVEFKKQLYDAATSESLSGPENFEQAFNRLKDDFEVE